MIAHLKGILLKKTTDSIIIDNMGIGYEVIAPLSTYYSLPEEDNEVSLHIHTHVREDALILFGFHSMLEKDVFRMLISVSGIGPKLAVNILSGIGPAELLGAIIHGDTARLQAVPGVGKKTAERIALELKDKAAKRTVDMNLPPVKISPAEDDRMIDDALSALVNLGYSAKQAKQAVDKAYIGVKEPTLERVIKEALRLLT